MVKLSLLVFPALLCGFLACGHKSRPEIAPQILLPDSKGSITGYWRGTLSDLDIVTPFTRETTRNYSEVNSYLNLNLFQYDLQVLYMYDSSVVEYLQAGSWKWEKDNPSAIVFFHETESFEIRSTGSLWSLEQRKNSEPGQWQGRMEFADDLSHVKIFDLVKEEGIAAFPDSAVFELTRRN